MKTLITGVNGFLGRYLCIELLKYGHEVIGIDIDNGFITHELYQSISVDLNNKEKIIKIVEEQKPDFIIHLASLKNRANNHHDLLSINSSDIGISLNIIESCKDLNNLKRFIFIGSCDEYGDKVFPFVETQQENPLNSYGLSKLVVSKTLLYLYRTYKFPVVILRPSVIYGPMQGKDMFLPSLIQSVLQDNFFSMTLGEQLRDYVYVGDVVNAILKCINTNKMINGEILNIASGSSQSMKDIAITVINLISPNNLELLKFGDLSYRKNEVMRYEVSINAAKKLIGWNPRKKFLDGLKETIDFYKSTI
jgi:UDP-glucose 4-epimerase